MAEYINRKEYCENYCRCSNEYCDRQSCPIWKAPAADVEPVRHGRWEMRLTWMATDTGPEYKAYCTVCNKPNKQYQPPYCPHCGAKMGMGRGGKNASKEM